MGGPELKRLVEVFEVAQTQHAVGKKAGIRAISERNVNGAHHQGEGGVRGSQIQVVDAGDLLIVLQIVSVRPVRLDLPAVGEDIHTGARGADGHGGVLGDGQLDEQSDRPMIGSQLEMEPEPGEEPLVTPGRARLSLRHADIGWLILLGDIGDEFLGVPDCPCGVVEHGLRCRRVSCNADPPAFVEQQGRSKVAGVEDRLGGAQSTRRNRPLRSGRPQ